MEPEAANFLVWTRRDPTGHLEWQDLGRQKKRNPFTPPLIRSSIDINGVPWFPFFFFSLHFTLTFYGPDLLGRWWFSPRQPHSAVLRNRHYSNISTLKTPRIIQLTDCLLTQYNNPIDTRNLSCWRPSAVTVNLISPCRQSPKNVSSTSTRTSPPTHRTGSPRGPSPRTTCSTGRPSSRDREARRLKAGFSRRS